MSDKADYVTTLLYLTNQQKQTIFFVYYINKIINQYVHNFTLKSRVN